MNATNEFGDCAFGDIHFFKIVGAPGNLSWELFAAYQIFMGFEQLIYLDDADPSWVEYWSLF